MAVNNISPVATYIANGITSEFSFSFKIINNTDVKLFVDNVELNYSTDYTVNILTSILTTVAIPASGAVVILQRDTTLNRDIDYTEGGGLSSSTLDNDLDKTTLLIQDQFERSLKRDVGSNNYNVNNNNIINVGTPTTPTDAANKAYVDSVGGGGVGGGVTDHTLLTSIGTNSHAVIDTHIADTSIHYSQASISITESQISDLGSYEPTFTKNTAFNKPFGTTVNTVIHGNDSRLSDARTPTTHTHTKVQISDFVESDYATGAEGDLATSALQNITAEQLANLQDIPTIVGNAGKLLKVNPTADGYIWGDPSGASISWGDIAGTLSLQTDLQSALDAKATTVNLDAHTTNTSIHYSQASISITESQISDLGSYEPSFTKNTAFNNNYGTTVGTVTQGNDSRLSDARTPTAHTHTESDITDLGSYVASTDATNIVALSQVAYDALTPNANTMYLIV